MNIKDKLFMYIDTETTSLDEKTREPLEIAVILERNLEIIDSTTLYMQPSDYGLIETAAIETSGLTIDKIRTFPSQAEGFQNLKAFLDQYIDPYDRNDKAYTAGYNVMFDIRTIRNLFEKQGDKYLGSYVNWRTLDLMYYFHMHDALGNLNLASYALKNVCIAYNIPLDAHKAMDDITATRSLIHKLILNR